MSTWLCVAIGIFLLWLLARTTLGSAGKNVDCSEFQRFLYGLIRGMQEGSVLEICHLGSRVFLRVRRCGEEARGVMLRFEIPRAIWSEPYAAEIMAAAATLGVEPIDVSTHPAVLLGFTEFASRVGDHSAGTHAALLAQAVFAALGVPKGARYRIRVEGPTSLRVWRPRADAWTTSASPVTRWLGRRIIAGHDKEVGMTRDRKNTQDGNGH